MTREELALEILKLCADRICDRVAKAEPENLPYAETLTKAYNQIFDNVRHYRKLLPDDNK